MTVRSDIYSLLSTDSVLAGLGITPATVLVTNMLDTVESKPFITIAMGLVTAEFSRVNTQYVNFWVNDIIGDYTRIDTIIERIKTILLGSGTIYRWVMDSSDLYDDGYKTIVKWTRFIVVSMPATV